MGVKKNIFFLVLIHTYISASNGNSSFFEKTLPELNKNNDSLSLSQFSLFSPRNKEQSISLSCRQSLPKASLCITQMQKKEYIEEVFKNDNPDLLRELLQTNPLLNSDHDKHNFMYIAAQVNAVQCLAFLLAVRNKHKDIFDSGYTAVHEAIRRGNVKIVEQFLSVGLSVDYKDYEGYPLLAIAIDYNQPEIVQMLLDKGADASYFDFYKNSLLHRAVKIGNPDILKKLLEKGIDLKRVNYWSQTALDLARSYKNIDIIRLLEHQELITKKNTESCSCLIA